MICEILSSSKSFAATVEFFLKQTGANVKWQKHFKCRKRLKAQTRRVKFHFNLTLFPPFKVKSDGTLYFEKVISEDEGRYTCKVTNGFGRPIEASAHIAVEYAARVSFTPTTQGRYSVMS